jgi:Rv2632c-like
MNRNDYWSASVSVAETDGWTHAVARLDMVGGKQFVGHGEARLNPADRDIWTIGAQIAAARALSDLAGQLLHAAADGIEEITHERAHLHL